MSNGKEVYLAFRKQSEMFRSGEKSQADAIQKGTAAWAIDYATLIQLRIEGVYLVGVLVNKTGDLYLSTLADFNAAPMMNYDARGGSLQRYLPVNKMLTVIGSVQPVKKATRRVGAGAVI